MEAATSVLAQDDIGLSQVTRDQIAAYQKRLTEARKIQEVEEEKAAMYVDGRRVTWTPQPGSQVEFMTCPLPECLYHGTRGPGKSDSLIMDYAQDVGKGYGASWRGILFRQTYPQLADIQAKTERWFRQVFPDATFNIARMMWEWPSGEVLMLRHMARHQDYWAYHGHELPWIGWEELTNWADDQCYRAMFSCNRSSDPRVPRKIRGTTNPYGVGTNWVKLRFRLGGKYWQTRVIADGHDADGKLEPPRAAIHGHISENKILLQADPTYVQKIAAAASNQAMADAWLKGSWNLIAGGMFDDVWSPEHNDLPRFRIPQTWRIDRAFDWGSSRPFSVGWYAVSDGSDLRLGDGRVIGTVRGDLFRVKEWYGWTGRANEGVRALAVDIARGIVERELLWGWRSKRGSRVRVGPADSSIFKVENGMSIATDMGQPVRIDGTVYHGVQWMPSDKGPGSRKNGWERMRKMIRDAQPMGVPRERPGLFVVGEECQQWIRTVLSLPRDEKDMDDVDSSAEDHCGDETRYRIRAEGAGVRSGVTTGNW